MFEVRRAKQAFSTTEHRHVGHDDAWNVAIPDQTGDVDIALDEPHEQAVASLEEHIAEAQEALTALKERREIGQWRRI